MKMWEIVPGLYQRGAFRHMPHKVERLRAHGIEVVVSLWYADPDMPGVVEYHQRYVPDGRQIDTEFYGAMAEKMAERIRDGRPVLVHCQGGRNRSGLLNALIVRELCGCAGWEAAAVVRAGRPGALTNPHFYRYLVELPAPVGYTHRPRTEGEL